MTSPGKFIGSPTKRREMDIMKLMMSDYEVQIDENSTNEFYIKFFGPKDTHYEGGVWKVRVTIGDNYPFKSPSIGFVNKIFHPNVDEASGSVCLDVINQTWSPMFDLINIFEVFLPQLLTYPNPTDPLNSEAAGLMLREPERYKVKVKDYVQRYAKLQDIVFHTKNKKIDDEEENNEEELDALSNASENDDDLAEFEL
ncbi:hypothetical protein ABK040_009029 [Willaertia magna]